MVSAMPARQGLRSVESAWRFQLGGEAMKKLSLALVLAAIASAFAALPFAASADSRERLVLEERMQITGAGSAAGSFVSAGGVNDRGPATATFSVDSRGNLTGTHVLEGSAGTIVMATRAKVRPFPPPTPPRVFMEGTWSITSGTGAYADLEGRGKITAVADFTDGRLTIIRDGRVSSGDGDDDD
jgi:hypothetical protein